MMHNQRSEQLGFTLIEVMVALLVVGIALPALMFQLGAQLDATDRFRQQTIASWVAKNQMSHLQLDAAAGIMSTAAFREGETELAGRRWSWQLSVEETPVPGLLRHRLDVAAMERPADTLASLTSYLSAAQAIGPSALSGDADGQD
ncbi:type II secretion system minor pseudopilin GspI [Pseudohongiella sp. SYSU M77423]|uniref:type II secretion system minor pseudopilin GspI n=1 Tax=unclassified Pseudohongiella TaxID=2629611 RepID=UPI001EFF6863|nr:MULTISPECIES: type II secretion system minor pseudopilin GspI [unclassified Pseudohongiella]MDH7944670.1 type II secretion system minor pseudopilin GspI [Pseudohongiella sp. SYSU M77423]